MSSEKEGNPKLAVYVTRTEYEQFLRDKSHIPECLHLDGVGIPDCSGNCPTGLVCITFRFVDVDQGIDAEWYACASQESVNAIQDRLVPLDEPQNDRKLKYLTFSL